MPIIVNVDVMLAKRTMSSGELAEKAVRFSTLSALCKALDCQTGDILEYQPD